LGLSRSPFGWGRVRVTERRTSAEDAQRLKEAGYVLEVAPTGKRCWREPGTGQLLSGDRARELLRLEEVRTLEEAGWERVEDEADTYWRRPDTGRLYPRGAAYYVAKQREEG
jgi:hypothetical protein